jgi:hypothetical protein
MHFDERDEGDSRIYAGALEAPRGGYIAAVVVKRMRGASGAQGEAYREENLACGHRWQSAPDALRYALDKARELIHRERHRLAC